MRNPYTLNEVTIDNSDIIKIDTLPEYDIVDWDLFDPKDFKKYMTTVERIVRNSFEYRQMVKYLRENFNMNSCSFYENVSNENSRRIKIHIHHDPITLYDMCVIVFNKRMFYHEDMSEEMLAKEVAEEFVLNQISGYFGAEFNDLADDLLKEKNIEGFIDVTCECYGYRGSIATSLMELKPSLCKLMSDVTFDEVKEIIEEVNKHLLLNNYDNKFICFDNFDDVSNFLKEHSITYSEEDESIFDGVIYIKK